MMKKINWMAIAAAVMTASVFVSVPAMAEEEADLILADETMTEVEASAETEAALAQIEVAGIAVVDETQVPAEAVLEAASAEELENGVANLEATGTEETEMAEAETEIAEEEAEVVDLVSEDAEFVFENEEVVVKATAAVLPEGAQLQVTKLEEGSEEYEAAKAAAAAYTEDTQYSFYSICFVADGEEVEAADASVSVEFKNLEEGSQVLEINEAGANEVAADEGSVELTF